MSTRDNRQVRELVNDLASLNLNPSPPTLRKEEPRGGIPAARGYAEKNYQPGTGGGGAGIASPLTEKNFFQRQYWVAGMPSSDGIFIFPALKRLIMQDANGAEAVFELAEPPIDDE